MTEYPDGETFAELDIRERYELRDRLQDVEPGDRVRLRWPSSRSSNTIDAEGTVYPVDDDVALFVGTPDRTGDIYVKVRESHLENKRYAAIVAHSTGGRGSNRQPRLGELLDVEVVDGGDDRR